jgi:hypothetical protein
MQNEESEKRKINHVQYASNQQFYEQMKSIQYINDPLVDLAKVPSAIVYYGTPCCSLRCCVPLTCLLCACGTCDDYYNYTTLINVGGVQKCLFKNIAKLNCSICGFDKATRFAYCKSLSFSSYDEYSAKEGGVQIAEMFKEPGCIICDICSLFLDVNISSENRLAGIVKYRGRCDAFCDNCCKGSDCCCGLCKGDCCYKYYYCCEILGPSKETLFIIYLRKCCLSCVPIDCCNEINFTIKSPGGANVGEIKGTRNCCNLCGIFGTNFTYTINFPYGSTPEMKLTIINAVISIDLFIL